MGRADAGVAIRDDLRAPRQTDQLPDLLGLDEARDDPATTDEPLADDDPVAAPRDAPGDVVGPQLQGAGLAFSAFKESEDGNWLVLRCVNLCDDAVSGAWRLPFAIVDARLSRLDETVLDSARAVGNEVTFEAPPRAIVTILVR